MRVIQRCGAFPEPLKCIVSKKDSTNSLSVELIVPEPLGNKNHILPKGMVCHNCNSHFARKIEKKALETEFFASLRHRNSIESKKGRIPKETAIIPTTKSKANVILRKNTPIEVVVDSKSFELVALGKINHLIIPWTADVPKNHQEISRFLAKIGYEMMASALITKPEFLQELVDDHQLNPLREYIRFNSKNQKIGHTVYVKYIRG